MSDKLIYVMDPHCGWCYGNSNNIESLNKAYHEVLPLEVIMGGMWLPPNAPSGGPTLEEFVREKSPRLEQVSGMEISEQYFARTGDSNYTFSSLEPCAAIVWIKQNDISHALKFTKEVQKALFVEGKRLDDSSTYQQIFEDLGIEGKHFNDEWLSQQNLDTTRKEFEEARKLASGYPVLLVSKSDQLYLLASGYFNLEQMKQVIDDKVLASEQ